MFDPAVEASMIELWVKDGFNKIWGIKAKVGGSPKGKWRKTKSKGGGGTDLLGPTYESEDHRIAHETLEFLLQILEGLTIPKESGYIPQFTEMIKLMTLTKRIAGQKRKKKR
jgi:hypothetical protein